jgi:hypothetical protein
MSISVGHRQVSMCKHWLDIVRCRTMVTMEFDIRDELRDVCVCVGGWGGGTHAMQSGRQNGDQTKQGKQATVVCVGKAGKEEVTDSTTPAVLINPFPPPPPPEPCPPRHFVLCSIPNAITVSTHILDTHLC